jgi:hypothetical protein
MFKVAIIGAGISSAVISQKLSEISGFEVTIFDKSRGVGGRMSTRYTDKFSFDHGAQYFTARDDRFKEFLSNYIDSGIVQDWQGKFITLGEEKPYKRDHFEPHYVANPRMNMICKNIFRDKNLKLKTRIEKLSKDKDDKWTLYGDQGDLHENFDLVISTIPCHQAIDVLPKEFEFYEQVSNAEIIGCYSFMLGFEGGKNLNINWSAAKVKNSPVGWISVNQSKPGRDKNNLSLLIQTTNEWAEENIDLDDNLVEKTITDELKKLLSFDDSKLAQASYKSLHRWRYAAVSRAVDKPYLLDDQSNIAAAGDWCLGARVESAFLSGYELAKAIIDKYRL